MKAIASYPSRHEADLAAGFLMNAGIQAMTRADDASGWEPGLTFVQSVWIHVDASDEERALGLLRQLADGDASPNRPGRGDSS